KTVDFIALRYHGSNAQLQEPEAVTGRCPPTTADDPTRWHSRRCATRAPDALTVVGGHAFIFPMAGCDPGIDESGPSIEPAIAFGQRADDAIVLGRVPDKIEVPEEDRIGRHRWHRA